jgi:hypothetical protein
MVEVSLVLALVVIVAIVVLGLLGRTINATFQCTLKNLQGQTCATSDIAGLVRGGSDNAYVSAVKADGPAGYWRLDDSGATIFDAVGTHNGTLSGTTAEGVSGALSVVGDKAIVFDGSSGSATVPMSALGAQWTLEAWVKTSTSTQMHIVEADPMEFYITADGNLGADKVPDVGTVTSTGLHLADGNWHYVVVSDDGTNVNLYADGAPVASTPTLGGTASLTGTTVYLARSQLGGGYFDGVLDEVAVYPTALGATPIATHWHLGCGC